MTKKLLLALLVIVMIAIPVLTACGTATTSTTTTTAAKPPTSSTGAPPPSSSASVPPASTSAPPPPPPASSTAAQPTSIKIGTSGGITSLDPTLMNGGGGQAGNNVFEYLLTFDHNNNIIPELADSYSWSSDNLTLTVKLKPGVQFSNGDPFTSADVAFSLKMYAAQPGPNSAQMSPAQGFVGTTIVDANTIQFNFSKIDVQWVSQSLTGMFMMDSTQYNKVGATAWANDPVGTGPYMFKDFAEGQYCDITYNPLYRGTKPPITDAKFFYVADAATRVSMLQAGEVDMIQDVPGSTIASLTQAGYTRYDVPQDHAICLQFGYLDTTVPWAKLQVRQAIDYALDKDTANQKIFGGIYQPGVFQFPYELGYSAANQPNYPFNIGKARQLMTDAGYANGFTMPLYYGTFQNWGSDLADYISGALTQIGITVKPMPMSDFGSMASSWTGMHNGTLADGVLLFDVGWPGNPDPSINLTNGFFSGKDNTIFDDPSLDALITQILQTPDNTARAALAQQAYTIIANTMPFDPLYIEVTVYAMNSNIQYTPTNGGMQWGPTNVWDLSYK